MTDERVLCENPDPDKQPTRIARWKYDLVRGAILAALCSAADGLAYRGLVAEVRSEIGAEELQRLGSASWYTTVVKLDLEAKGEIERVPGTRPQLVRVAGSDR